MIDTMRVPSLQAQRQMDRYQQGQTGRLFRATNLKKISDY
jgi:hypothetical protein